VVAVAVGLAVVGAVGLAPEVALAVGAGGLTVTVTVPGACAAPPEQPTRTSDSPTTPMVVAAQKPRNLIAVTLLVGACPF
jgi:hypothetical protein